MKYVIALLFALAFSNIDAQNLQFSQVLTFSGTQAVPEGFTVPEGKVWKIVSIKSYMQSYNINGVSATTSNSNGAQSNGVQTNLLPIWLKSGDVVSIGGNPNNGYFLSIIEFTLVP